MNEFLNILNFIFMKNEKWILVNFIFLKNEKYKFSFFIFQYHDDTKRTQIYKERRKRHTKIKSKQ